MKNDQPMPLEKIQDFSEAIQDPILPLALRRGLRKALDGGRGRLRMDPEDLAVLIGKAIDMEVDRLARIRKARAERKKWQTTNLFRQAELFIAPVGTKGISGLSMKGD